MVRLPFTPVILALFFSLCGGTLVNVEVKRVIDVSSTIAISRSTVTLKNNGDSPVDSFFIAVHKHDISGLSDLWVSLKSASSRKALPLQPTSNVPGLKPCCRGYKVSLIDPLSPGASVTLDVRMDVAGVVKPVPAEIKSFDTQFMSYSGNAYFYSPYHTERLEASVTLGSPEVISLKAPKPNVMAGKKLKLGPFTDVKPLSHETLTVRFRNDRGFLVARRAAKEFYVSHWGRIATTEMFEVENAAAKHVGEWSRVNHDSMSGRSRYATAIGDVWANLPGDATRVEYRDLVGNITSSKLRKESRKKRAVQLRFRFPMMGGWRNHFWIRYDLTLGTYAKSYGQRHVLSVPIMPSLHGDILCEKLEVDVVLPEWSRDIEVEEHPSIKLDVEQNVVRRSMTVFGRPVVKVRVGMIRTMSKHSGNLVVRYAYNPLLVWVTPMIAVVWILTLFLVGIGCIRMGLVGGAEDDDEVPSDKVKAS